MYFCYKKIHKYVIDIHVYVVYNKGTLNHIYVTVCACNSPNYSFGFPDPGVSRPTDVAVITKAYL